MKTSNIIIVSLISGLLLIILTAALDVKLYGEYRTWKIIASVEKSTTFESINHIVVKDLSVTIELNDTNQVSVSYRLPEAKEGAGPDKPIQNSQTILDPVLKISGDTLFIDKDIVRGQENNNHVTISISDHLHSVISHQAYLTIKGGIVKHVQVEGKRLNMKRVVSEPQLHNISINAKNCNVTFSPVVDTLEMNLNNVDARLVSIIDLLAGELKNESSIYSQTNVSRLNIKKDKSSNIQIR